MSSNSTLNPAPTTDFSAPRRGRRPIPVDASALERCASELPGQREAAKALGMAQSTLVQKLLDSPELRRAWERGRAKYEGARADSKKARAKAVLSPRERPTLPPPPVASGRVFERPSPRFTSGTHTERVLAAVRSGRRTFGELLASTALTHDALVLAVTALMQQKCLVARSVGGERCHYLPEEAREVWP